MRDLRPLLSRQELLGHVEEGMGKNLAYRCSDAVHASVHSSQSYMIGKETAHGGDGVVGSFCQEQICEITLFIFYKM